MNKSPSRFRTPLVAMILLYFRFLAKLQLRKNPRAIIIGITGSLGKTSTRKGLAVILEGKGRVKQSIRANSEIGIPLNILGLSPLNYSLLDWLRLVLFAPLMLFLNWERFDYYIVEMGIDSPHEPKNMTYLLRIIRPDIAVILNAGLTHSQAFDSLVKDRDQERRVKKIIKLIAAEKMKLAHGITPTGTVIINQDQPELRSLISSLPTRVIKFGRLKGANFHFTPSKKCQHFSLKIKYQGRTHTLSLPDVYETSYAYTFSAALATATSLGIPLDFSLTRLKAYRPPAGRFTVFSGIKDTLLIDSSYNSSPSSVLTTLHFVTCVGSKRHKLGIIGDMNELGLESKSSHKLLADWIVKHLDEAILFGPETKAYTLPVLKARQFPTSHFARMNDLLDHLTDHLLPNSVVLIKGSQDGIYLERATAKLLKNSGDTDLLCRRGKYWDKIRSRSK